jgi:putative endopeptidase
MTSLTRRTVTASTIALVAGCATQQTTASTAPAQPAAPAHPPAQLGAWGVDLDARDLTVKPGDDFYHYAGGKWMANTQIPPDRTSWGSFVILADKAERDSRAIIEHCAAAGGAHGSNDQKIGDWYKAYLDTDAIEHLGIAPTQADMAAINHCRTHEDIVALMAKPGFPGSGPIRMGVSLDARNPDRYIVSVTHAGLGLPEREYYRRPDQQFVDIRTQYAAHIGRTLGLANQGTPAQCTAKAQRIMALETAIAEQHWPIADRRDRSRTYNPKTRAELKTLAPDFPWDAYFTSSGLGAQQGVIVRELSAMAPLGHIVKTTPVSTWKEYLTWHYVRGVSDVLPKAFDDENFAFYGTVIGGQPQQRERWKRAVGSTNGALGEAVGQIYVQQHFPPESKVAAQQLVENLRHAYHDRIAQLSWMTAETKTAAQEKLAMFRPKIGYPDKWRDYSALDVQGNDAFGNERRNAIFRWNYDLARLTKPSDRDEWSMTPQTVNAYYNSTFNEIVFPAAILQPPFFDPNADAAVNYGAIGAVIGHEMGHGFDDQGAKSDGHGVLRDWWNPTDVAAFTVLVNKLAAEYDTFEPLPGIHVNGRLTSGENIGDNGGMQAAHYAYTYSLNGQPPAAIDGFSADQRFFLGFAQVWRSKYRDQAVRNQVLTDPHSPSQYRCNGTVRNMDEWYAAFNVQPGDRMYAAPADRVKIW